MSASGPQPVSGSHPDCISSPTLELTVRFSASLPDLQLSLEADPDATTASLKQLIRASLPADLRDRRIRLIHAGKALNDETSLDVALKRPSSLPGAFKESVHGRPSNGKGKEPVRNPTPLDRVYVHCSIGDVVLSATELALEFSLANRKQLQDGISTINPGTINDGDATAMPPAPRGFDRLLSAGFSHLEVQNLRLQFMAIQAHTHTPDTMPSPNTLRRMEDRWLDNGNATGMQTGTGTGTTLIDDDGSAGALDDMLWGAAMGFFWPLGCLFWGFREDGIWTQRRKMAIVVGVVLNVGIGLIRYTS